MTCLDSTTVSFLYHSTTFKWLFFCVNVLLFTFLHGTENADSGTDQLLRQGLTMWFCTNVTRAKSYAHYLNLHPKVESKTVWPESSKKNYMPNGICIVPRGSGKYLPSILPMVVLAARKVGSTTLRKSWRLKGAGRRLSRWVINRGHPLMWCHNTHLSFPSGLPTFRGCNSLWVICSAFFKKSCLPYSSGQTANGSSTRELPFGK